MKLFRIWMMIGMIFGCGDSGMTPEERLALLVPDAKQTVPVSGQVLVDGQPVKDLWVYLIPKGTTVAKGQQPESRALTDDSGNFRISTYMDGDGAPQGDYVLCVEWLKFRQTGGQWIGPDRLGKRYSDSAKSQFSVTVTDQPVVVPVIELKSK